jgi:F-type H+-transporting ATPase subunit a
MEIHPSIWTTLIASVLGKEVKELALWDHVIASGIVFTICLVIGLLLKSRLKLVPGHFQQVFEVTVSGLLGMLDENLGKDGRKFLPLIGTLAFFIFISNFLGMVPTFSSATGNWNTTIACALIVFIYYNWLGLKEHGGAYVKPFMGPMPALAPLMFPIEIISHLARPFSLSIRLFGNITGEHIVAGVFYSMIPFLLPVPIMAIGLFAAFLQTFIFIMLTMVYIAGSLSHDH